MKSIEFICNETCIRLFIIAIWMMRLNFTKLYTLTCFIGIISFVITKHSVLSFLQHSQIYRLSCRHTRQTGQAYIIEDYQNKE